MQSQAGPVSIGETWTDRKKIKVPYREMDLEIALESRLTLDRILESREGRKAFVSAAFSLSLSGGRPLQGGLAAEFKGRGDGTGTLTILADDGTVAEYRMGYALDAAMAARRGNETLVEWPFRLSFAGALVRLDGR